MSKGEAARIVRECEEKGFDNTLYTVDQYQKALNITISTLKEKYCSIVEGISQEFVYDTETRNFVVYRHKYTGEELHVRCL